MKAAYSLKMHVVRKKFGSIFFILVREFLRIKGGVAVFSSCCFVRGVVSI
jgi:hypothetical protein